MTTSLKVKIVHFVLCFSVTIDVFTNAQFVSSHIFAAFFFYLHHMMSVNVKLNSVGISGLHFNVAYFISLVHF